MHIAIASRLMAEKASALIKTPHAIISITDPDSDLPTFALNGNRLGILSLRFYDLDDISDQMEPIAGRKNNQIMPLRTFIPRVSHLRFRFSNAPRFNS